MKEKIGKLVRDKVPEYISESGRIPQTRELIGGEFLLEAKRKLLEEAEEVFKAQSREYLVEELADVLEVVDALAKAAGIARPEIMTAREKKNTQMGKFEKKLYLESIETSSTTTKE